VDLNPDVILVITALALQPLLQETRSIPIVFTQIADPVGAGLVASLARPGGNITGFTVAEYSMSGKLLEVLKEVAPQVTRVAVILHPDDRKFGSQKRQPLTGAFRGTAHLGAYHGHGPKGVGAICDPTAFSGVVEVVPGVLGPRDGKVVDLVEPGCELLSWPFTHAPRQEVFRDILPWVVIRIGS
jgi:ABC transporter substrate binding protein